eukprot:6735136-Alexandrium_andersonii.AAC.1
MSASVLHLVKGQLLKAQLGTMELGSAQVMSVASPAHKWTVPELAHTRSEVSGGRERSFCQRSGQRRINSSRKHLSQRSSVRLAVHNASTDHAYTTRHVHANAHARKGR